MKAVPLELPLLGLNTINPFLMEQNGFARELTNYAIQEGRISMRPAVRYSVGNMTLSHFGWFDYSTGTPYGIERSTGNIRNISTAAGATNIGGAMHANATRVKHLSLDFVIGARQPRDAIYPFAAWTFTTIGITATAITSACSYKGRLYVASGTTVEYSAVAAVTGAMAGSIDFAEFLDGQTISRIFSVTVQPGNDTQNVFVIFGTGGKVLVYQGDYPASSTWDLMGSYNMEAPVSNDAIVEIDGDLFVSTSRYAYWFKDLFQNGAQVAYENSPTRPIENLWQQCSWSGTFTLADHAHAFYYKPLDAIIVQCSAANLDVIANYGTDVCYFVYFRKYKAWALWLMAQFFAPVLEFNNNYFATSSKGTLQAITPSIDYVVDTYSVTTVGDTSLKIFTSWKTPYLEAFSGRVQKLNNVRVFYMNDVSSYFDWLWGIFDFSDYNQEPWGFYTQPTATSFIEPGNYANTWSESDHPNTWSQYNTMFGVPGAGGSFSIMFSQAREEGSNDQQKHQIYGAIAYVEDGGAFS